MSADGIAFVYDFRPDRADYTGYGAVTDSFVAPILAHLPQGFGHRVREPVDGMLNVRFYTWPAPQEHVFISHGIADKAYRTPAKLFGFRHVHASGPWWSRYYAQRGPQDFGGRVFETGYPKLDPLFDGTIPRVPRAEGGRLRVLWAPTHSGVNGQSRDYPSSFLELSASIATLLPADEFEVEIAPHPRMRDAEGLPIKVTSEEYARADVVVADAGSTVYEAWALGLPVVFPDWIVDRKVRKHWAKTLEGVIYSEGLGYHVDAPRDLADAVRRAAEHGIGEREAGLIEDVLPERYRGNGGALTAAALEEIARGDVPRLASTDFLWVTSEDGTRSEHVSAKAYRSIWAAKGYRPSRLVLPELAALQAPGKG